MDNYKDFNGMDFNDKEKELCKKNPILAIQMYRRRTGFGLRDARDAAEETLGMDPMVYGRVRERIAFSIFYNGNYLLLDKNDKDLEYPLKLWRELKRSKDNEFIDRYYDLAEHILDLYEMDFDEDDLRNGD